MPLTRSPIAAALISLLSLAVLLLLQPVVAPGQVTLGQEVLDRARELGKELKEVQDQIAVINTKWTEAASRAEAPTADRRKQHDLLGNELAAIRQVYRADRAALAAIDGKHTGTSNAAPADVRRAEQIRREMDELVARHKRDQASAQSVRQEYTADLARLNQAQARAELELRRLRAPYLNEKEAL